MPIAGWSLKRSFKKFLVRIESERFEPERVSATRTWMAERMVKCYERDMLCWYIIYGLTGAGKSTYAILSLKSAAEMLGLKVTWDYICKRLLFNPEEIVEYFNNPTLEYPEGSERDLGFIIDDAGVHLHAYKAFTDRKLVMALSGLLQVARTQTANIILTTPSPLLVLKALRIIPGTYFIRIARRSPESAIASVYTVDFYPPSRLSARKVIVEEFPLKMPFKKDYDVARKWYVSQQLVTLSGILGEEAEGEG